jgi:3-deoxy-manno-octulosonate cytidylyltransferase (CMP-KDO synthetase)
MQTEFTKRGNDNRDVIAVIPARYQSSRFPGKPLALIAGVPMIVRVCRRLAEAIPAGQIMVATDSPEIEEVTVDAGFAAVQTPSGCLTGTDRIFHAMASTSAEIIVNVQGDEPMVNPADVLSVIEAKRRNPGAVINAMAPLASGNEAVSPNVPKVVTNESGRLVYMSRAPVPFSRTPQEAVYRRQVCIYAFSPAELRAFGEFGRRSVLEQREDIEILRFFELDTPVHMIEVAGGTYAVDTPDDIARVEGALSERE